MKKASSPRIALITDFGLEDSFVGEMKGMLLTVFPQANLVDITHQIEPFNIRKGAVVLNQVAPTFPEGTIFLAVVDPGVGSSRKPVLLRTLAKRYYIGPDNGIFGLVADREGIDKIWELDKIKYHRNGLPSSTFHGRDIFSPVAGHLASGVAPEDLGTLIKRLEPLSIAAAKVSGVTVSGEVLYVDRYGNVVTNIPATISSTLKPGALLRVSFGNQNFTAPFVMTYSAVPSGRPLLLSNSQGFLEFALNQGSASKQFKVQVGMPVMVRP